MKIKDTVKDYDEVCAIKHATHVKPEKQSVLLRKLIKLLSKGELKATNFTYETEGMERDRERTQFLNSLGICVLHFSNSEIWNSFRGVCEEILKHLPDLSVTP